MLNVLQRYLTENNLNAVMLYRGNDCLTNTILSILFSYKMYQSGVKPFKGLILS